MNASAHPEIRWHTVCRLDDIPARGARRVARERGLPVAVFRTAADKVFALLDRCPHRGGPLSQGIVFGDSVACPLHNWTIALGDGCAQAPDQGCTRRFACRLQDGAVQLDLDELHSLALDDPPPVAPGNLRVLQPQLPSAG
jgi:nitrite reductase (NADH) small subunit